MRSILSKIIKSITCLSFFLFLVFISTYPHAVFFTGAQWEILSDSPFLISNYTIINGLSTRIEYMNTSDNLTPVVLMAQGLGGNKEYTSTLQTDIAMNGYIAISFSEPKNDNNQQYVINEKKDIDSLLNWIILGNLGIGNNHTICLFGQSAGGNSVLTFASDPRVYSIVAVVPANFNVPISINTKPIAIIVGDNDSNYRNDGIAFYNKLNPPKWFCDIRNGSHYLGITDKVESLPTSYTPIVENYILAWLNYSLKADNNAYRYLTVYSTSDINLLNLDWNLLSSSYSSNSEFLKSNVSANPIQISTKPNATIYPSFFPSPTNDTKFPNATFYLKPNLTNVYPFMILNEMKIFVSLALLILIVAVLILIKNRSK
jgi:hypothetical protein